MERVPEPSETERARRRGEEPYSCTVTTPDGGIAKGSHGYGMRDRYCSLAVQVPSAPSDDTWGDDTVICPPASDGGIAA